MHLLDTAEAEYSEFNIRPLRTERRRIWNGRRYVWRLCQVYSAGWQQPVEPSTAPLVKMSRRGFRSARSRNS
jgi:hypothetical protein